MTTIMIIIGLLVCGGGFVWCEIDGTGVKEEIGPDGRLKHVTVEDVDAEAEKGILFWGAIIFLLILIFA